MIAETLCANGAKVYIVGRRKEVLDSVVEQYGSKGPGKIIALPGDISSKEDMKRLAAEVAEKEPEVSSSFSSEKVTLDALVRKCLGSDGIRQAIFMCLWTC